MRKSKSDDVVLFMKGTPQFPHVRLFRPGRADPRLSRRALQGRERAGERRIRQGIKDFSNWPTIPQLYVKGEFVGGCDIIREMFQAGELQTLFEEKGVSLKKAG